MPASIALLACFLVVIGLFYLNRNRRDPNSIALWIPSIWIGLAGSRAVSSWLGVGQSRSSAGGLDGSPLDAAIYGTLVVIGCIILAVRWGKTSICLIAIIPIIIYSFYCLLSVTWSPIPVPAFKRWFKDLGDVVMVLVIVTDPQPLAAIRRLFSRIGFIIFPFSIVLIRYTLLGRAWDVDGTLSNVGVTLNKNMLGLSCFVISLGLLWNVRWLLTHKEEPNRGRRLIAEGSALIFGLYLLSIAHSSTSVGCFVLGTCLMLATHLPVISGKPFRVSLLCFGSLILGGLVMFGGGVEMLANLLGRESHLSGRTDIWAALIPAATNPIIGSGFESYWSSPNARVFFATLADQGWYRPESLNEAHNGYLEIYLNLGWIGVFLIALILATGWLRAFQVIQRHPQLGSLMLAYITSGAVYSITEAGFRTLNLMWIFILLSVVSVSAAHAALFQSTGSRKPHRTTTVRRPVYAWHMPGAETASSGISGNVGGA